MKAYHCAHVNRRRTEIFGDQVRKIVGGEGVSKCVIFDENLIFGVRILSENFSHYTAVVGLRTFRGVDG